MNTYPEKEKIAVVNRYLNGETISKNFSKHQDIQNDHLSMDKRTQQLF